MNVSEAMVARKTRRNFLDTPIANEIIEELLRTASRAPSGGNLQPWRIYLKEPYRSSRFKCGEDMYTLLGIPRDDKPARYEHLARNFRFFGAPAAIFVYVDRMLFCGCALGHADPNAPVNSLVTDREPLDNWATFL